MAQLSSTTIYGSLKVSGNATTQGNSLVNDLGLLDSNSSHYLLLSAGSDLTADRYLTLTTGDSSRTLTINGDATLVAGTMVPDSRTIAGYALTGDITLSTLSAGEALSWSTGSAYNGSAASTLAVDAAAAGTPSAWKSVTTGSITLGAGLTTGTLNLDAASTDSHTSNLATGATASAKTKVVNVGTAGASGSTTTISIGSTVAGSKGTTTIAGNISLATVLRTTGSASYLTVTTPADTGITASTESIGANFTAATRTWAAGALILQRERVFDSPTYAFAGASTLTTAINVDIGIPVAGTNATITNSWALRASNTLFTGLISQTYSGTTSHAYAITANDLTTASAIYISANKLTTGSGITVSTTASDLNSANTSEGVYITRSGTYATGAHDARGVYSSVTATGTVTKYAGYFEATGAGTANYGVYATASGGTANVAGRFAGDVEIDDSSANAGFKLSFNNTSKTLDFVYVGA